MKRDKVQPNMAVQIKGGKLGKVKKIGTIFIKVELSDGTIIWVSSKEIEPI